MSEVAARIRSERQVWAAPGSSHDRVVTASRILLPVGIGILAAFLVMAPLTKSGDVSFLLDKNKVEVAKERLRIQQALYRGEDGKGQPFALTAGSAIQKSSREPIVQLKTLSAAISLPDGPATLIANKGNYNMNSEQVAVEGPIRFRAANGYQLDTHDATVDLKTRKLQSGSAVTGTVPQGTFSANGMKADLESHIVTLDGNARLRIVPGRNR
ncbi:LPS export ABC transporter periplasmic protein LptC [Sphingomonas sp. So64.6b]|uniref:LPS export ABC transporter periplasmic protein LptC n=1 Tax=Sphingomonas sp. So64.6b TaxID=2997354 RepID=UPI00160336A3|nr:LPS export ABC transporter periplasmic protein LptC [Sphingomonas sp. So64.6b]QNA86035.1 LPS export ABC transporter periplasmic protein LptC [Sphingomonas sp. So64.6b]